MPRGRHRHEQPLHRLLPPAAVAAAALACAGGAWLVGAAGFGDTDTVVLRGLAAAAAATAVTGAVIARRWDRKAGRKVSELEARRAGAEWRAEERQAELEGELEEAGELRAALEKKLAAKRAELGRLRNEHAALLRRYANAETERAGALEGRRRLELEAATPTRAITAGATDHRSASGAPTPLTYLQASEALRHLKRSAERQRRLRAIEAGADDVAAVAAATPVPPPRVDPPRRLGGGFDFFGAGKKASGSGRQSGPVASAPVGPVAPMGPVPPHARPAGPVAPTGRAAQGPESRAASHGTAGAADDEGESERAPEPAPPSRPERRPSAGKVVDLGADDEALDITELRGAIS